MLAKRMSGRARTVGGMGDVALSMDRVVKTFGSTRALDELDLEVTTGEVHGYLGPNGAGKSVTIRVLLGLLRHDSGSVQLLGGDPWRDAVELHRRVAYVPGDVSLWPNLSGGEIIDYFARLRGDVDQAKRNDLVERFELDPRKKASAYSKGNRQKVALITALASDAELLLLDEPTAGLSPLYVDLFFDKIREIHQTRGVAIVLAEQNATKALQVADRVMVLSLGEAFTVMDAAELTTQQLKEGYRI